MFTQFRTHYPTGSLISELLLVERGTYLVRALVQVGGVTLASGMAAAPSIEQAEDQARQRAIAVLGMPMVSPPAPSVSPGSATRTTRGSQSLEPPAAVSQIRQTANSTPSPPTSVSASTPTSFFDQHSSPKTVDTDASVTSNSISDTTGDALATVVEDTDATSDTSDDPIWSASYTHQSSQTDLGVMSDETTQASSSSFDYIEVNASITVEVDRLGWDKNKEEEYLQRVYGQRERSVLDDDNLLDFLHYLQAYSQTTQELKRLDWTEKQGREHLELTYNQRSRLFLSCQQLQEFRDYLQSQPQPNQGLF
ncbi:MAG: hypothetical protein GDA43_25980 [Hormoscilla sp. SP5CHS1]|nr:hypothetical protein [Hormoscilla sp. SP12CHS1]MBC6456179.1 hypothetical protein [Hormoscilla sp. SP5CHS1]